MHELEDVAGHAHRAGLGPVSNPKRAPFLGLCDLFQQPRKVSDARCLKIGWDGYNDAALSWPTACG